MSSVDSPDFAAIKARQQQMWSAGDYAPVGALVVPVAEQLCQNADLQAGWRVLDVATGTGNAAIAAARSHAQVVGVDYAPALLERARARAELEGFAIEFREGDAENLPFPDATFDATISVFGVMFAPNQAQAARELLRVTKPGGRILLANWTPASFPGEMFRVIGAHVPPPPGLVPPTMWSVDTHIAHLFGDEVRSFNVQHRSITFHFESPETMIDLFRTHFGPAVKAFEAAKDPERLRADLIDVVKRHNRNPGNPIALPAEYVEVVAIRR